MINFFSRLSPDAEKLLNEIKEEENDIDPEKRVCTKSDGKILNFNTFKPLFKFDSSIYDCKIILE